jgi:nucleotide-binding universal stress UspA family protein
MFKKILIALDGSALSLAAAFSAVRLAKATGAPIVLFEAVTPYQLPIYLDAVPDSFPSEDEYKSSMRRNVERLFRLVTEAGVDAGVPCTGERIVFARNTAQAIVDAAVQDECDLIVMGSHGRSGLSRLFLGSVAGKVLTLAQVPVLVNRSRPETMSDAQTLIDAANAAARNETATQA